MAMEWNFIKQFSKAKDLFDDGKKKEELDRIKTLHPDLLLKERDEYGNTALHKAIEDEHGYIDLQMGNLYLCKEILKKCPSLLYQENNHNQTVLHQAIAPDCETAFRTDNSAESFLFIDFFVSVGVDELATTNGDEDYIYMKFKRWMKMQDLKGDTALVIAAHYGDLHVVKRFIEVDRQYNLGLSKVVGLGGKTALDYAVENENLEMVKLLTDKEDPHSNFIPYSISRDMFDRVRRGDLDYIKTVELNVLLNARNEYTMSVLLMATDCNQFDCCKEILKRCPSLLYHHSNDKFNVLHFAADRKIYRLIDYFVSVGIEDAKSEGGMENMIRFKKWINLQSIYGHTALMIAVFHRGNDMVKRFVEVDRQYNLGLSEIVNHASTWYGATALQLAMDYEDHEMIKTLTGSGDPKFYYGANSSGTGD